MWELRVIDTDKSLYIAVADAIERDIQSGILKAGERLPAQRELAKIVGVNVTTITRAYTEAEKRGLVTSIVGSGTYISSDLGFNSALLNTEKNEKRLIEMGLVLPLYSMEPDISLILEKVLHKNDLSDFMGYTPPQGLYRHRLTGSRWIKRYGVNAEAENIIITAGAQHALNCIFSSVFQPGDRIAVDCLTYPGVKTAAKLCGIQLEAVAMDDEGMTPQGLATICNRHDVKGVYTVSTMQNPTNAAMSAQRRASIAEIIEKNNLILIEDDLYRFLSSEDSCPLALLIPEQSIYISGISKAFYAGLRICFVATPKRFCNRISQAVVDTLWMAPTLNAEIACECIVSGAADEIIALKREEIRRRAYLIKSKLSGYSFRYVPDSMFVWLELPAFRSSSDFEKTANDNGINVISSEKFSIGGIIPPSYVRVSLSGADSMTEFENGLDILLKILNREIGSAGGVI
ncbi:MAG: putative DNA-binding protein [Firmicutes bacterium]|nr:putative DNA-binding protein [Bacillota bacterium]